MDLKNLIQVIQELGPGVVTFSVGLWGIYQLIMVLIKLISKNDEKQKENFNNTKELVSLIINALDQKDARDQKKHSEAAEYRKLVIRKCNEFAGEIMKELDADRVVIYDYCNGSQSLSGIPFLHYRTIAEKERDSKYKKIKEGEKTDIGSLGNFLLDLEKQQIIKIRNIKLVEDKYPELSYYMQYKHKYKGVWANIIGGKSSLGFISITFNSNKKVDYDKTSKLLYLYSQKISNLLDYSNINL